MKKIYIEDKNGVYVSEDGTKRYTCLTGKELYSYLNEACNSQKFFEFFYDGRGNKIGIQIPEEMLEEHLIEKERRKYLKKIEKEMGYTIVSFYSSREGQDGEVINYESVIADDSDDFIEEIAHKADIKTLKKALASLNVEEYEIIYRLYLSDMPISERAYAREMRIPQKTLNCRKLRIFKKIRKFF